jgi:Ser/Thr protein kinase RdoA (MazF antagonist)
VLNEIHEAPVLNVVTDQKDNLKAIIGRPAIFTNDELSAVHSYIDSLPGKRQLCHGDMNLGNLILRDADW